MQKDLTYTLIYKRDDSTVSVKLYFVDEDGEEIKKPTKQSVTVESGTDNKPTELFPDDLKKGEYEELKIGGSTYELSGAKYKECNIRGEGSCFSWDEILYGYGL